MATLTHGSATHPERHDAMRRVRAIVAGSSGNLVEWYDFYVYSFTALYFAAEFFPKGNQTTQLLQAAGVFAAGFFMRPVGSWLFGWLADKRGRRFSLIVGKPISAGALDPDAAMAAGALKHFVWRLHAHEARQKRGGGAPAPW